MKLEGKIVRLGYRLLLLAGVLFKIRMGPGAGTIGLFAPSSPL